MKKSLMLLLGCGLFVNAQADQGLCGYKDFFHLGDSTPPGIYIVTGSTNADVYMQIIGPRSFELRDTPGCTNGYAHVTIAFDSNNWCDVAIKDGPYMMHPTVSASCLGLLYKGMSYDGMNSYSYSLNFA